MNEDERLIRILRTLDSCATKDSYVGRERKERAPDFEKLMASLQNIHDPVTTNNI